MGLYQAGQFRAFSAIRNLLLILSINRVQIHVSQLRVTLLFFSATVLLSSPRGSAFRISRFELSRCYPAPTAELILNPSHVQVRE